MDYVKRYTGHCELNLVAIEQELSEKIERKCSNEGCSKAGLYIVILSCSLHLVSNTEYNMPEPEEAAQLGWLKSSTTASLCWLLPQLNQWSRSSVPVPALKSPGRDIP
jgi:hypothetical protein